MATKRVATKTATGTSRDRDRFELVCCALAGVLANPTTGSVAEAARRAVQAADNTLMELEAPSR
jgi:hypothetical protein